MEVPVVKIENLSHRYNLQWAVRDINIEIPSTGIHGFLGSNGAGKSTTLNIICGVVKQTEGKVYIKGIDARKHPVEAKRHIGFLPQKPPLYEDLTVEEYLSYCADLRWIPRDKIRPAVDDVLEKCGIVHFKKRLIKNLSGGYQQRVGIAQAIIHRPELVVLDEPTNGLDPNQINEIRALIIEIARERAVLLSTHILSEIQATCDHILMIEEGKLVFTGTVDDFNNYMIPNTLYLTFMNAPPVEILEKTEGVVKVEEIGKNDFRLYFTEAQEVIDKIVEQSAAGGWKLSELRVEKSSFETIFTELSKKTR
ncbi:MAG: ABC transporter ATP-binding protein [Odoribacteraceae bacterium]|jgi:ABC-2 type transport system ATP-binding protein|nr:ABC transporter ATP-binding protein [Odoribacteraceae bacterium]